MAGSEPLASAGAALRTLHAFTAALDAAARRLDEEEGAAQLATHQ
jgi:hypothetical protein